MVPVGAEAAAAAENGIVDEHLIVRGEIAMNVTRSAFSRQQISLGTLIFACCVAGIVAFSVVQSGVFNKISASSVKITQAPTVTGSEESKAPTSSLASSQSPTASKETKGIASGESKAPSIVFAISQSPTTFDDELTVSFSEESTSPSSFFIASQTPTAFEESKSPSSLLPASQSPSNIFTQPVQHTDEPTTAPTPTCNSSQLLEVMAKSKWRYKTADELDNQPYDTRCRFVYARWNCDKGSNTASDMVLEYSKSEMRRLGCHVPSNKIAMDQLIENNHTMFLCGDSHIAQIYLDILCSFQTRIHRVDIIRGKDTFETIEVTPDDASAAGHYGPESLPVCHPGNVEQYWGVPALGQTQDKHACNYFRGRNPGESVCATFKKTSNGQKAAVICLMYTRPIGNAAGAQLCETDIVNGVPTSHRIGGETFRSFDTVFVNTYVDQQVLVESLDGAGFVGKCVMINKNQDGQQMMISVDTANETPMQLLDPFKVDMLAFNTTAVSMQVLDTQQILFPRLHDTFAVVYPTTGHLAGKDERQVCCASKEAFYKKECVCDAKAPLDWTKLRSCRNTARDPGRSTCSPDSHLCLPGIVAELVTSVFSVALTP